MKLLYSAWTLVQIFGSFAAAKDGHGHVRVRGLQVESQFEVPFEDPMAGGFAFGDTLYGKKTSGKKNGGGNDPNDACCAGRPLELTFKFTGLACGVGSPDGVDIQGSSKASCAPGGTFPSEDVTVLVESNKGDALPLFKNVNVGDLLTVAFDGGFESNTFLSVFKGGGEPKQKVGVHTSCSADLFIGFNFGAFELVDYGPRTGICAPPIPPTTTEATTTTTTTSPAFCTNDHENGKIDTGCKDGCPLCEAEFGEDGTECRVCINDADGQVIDSGCTSYSPICPVPSGTFGDECVFCIDNTTSVGGYFDDGCLPEQPFCNAHQEGGEGTACFKCQHTDDGEPDPGCPDAKFASTCVALNGRFGNKCAVCINDKNNIRYSSTVMGPDFIDTGCKPESPVCFGAHYWEGGKACVKCVNDVQAEDPSHPDSGCSGDLPICNADILGEAGTECLPIPIVPDTCNTKLRDPANGPYFVNLVANALDPSFKYEPDSVYDSSAPYSYMVNHPKVFTVEIGLGEHDPGFTCVEGGVKRQARTKIYGYGQDGVYTWPGKTFEVKKAVNIDVMWENKILPAEHILTGTDNSDLPPIEVTYLPGASFNITPTDNSDKTVVDTSLHWAYSLKDIKGSAGFTGPCPTANGTCFEQFGVPVVTHLHGGHSNFEFDGNPEFFFNYDESVVGPEFITTDYTYHNNLEAASIWYHDHGLGITRLNVYAGLAGFYFLRDPVDGDTGKHGNALGLPAFPYELAYAIQDRNFKNNGELSYPAFPGDPEYQGFIIEEEADLSGEPFENWGPTALAEFFGDHMVVNGKVWPKSIVEPRNYRLRLLNGCDSRFLVLNFVKVGSVDVVDLPATGGDLLDFYVIGSDQGLKEQNGGDVTSQNQVIMGPGERIDVIIDFSQAEGKRVILKNSGGDEPFGGLPTGPTSDSTSRIMAFDITKEKDTAVGDTFNITVFNSLLPEYGHPPVPEPTRIRRVALFEGRDEYNRLQPLLGTAEPATDYEGNPVNWPDEPAYSDRGLTGQVEGTATWSTEPSTENPAEGDTEEWYIINVSADAHPIHLHLVDFEVISRHALKFDLNLTVGEETEPVPDGFVPAGNGLYLSEQAVVQHTGDAGSGRKIEYSCDTTADPDCWFESTPTIRPEYTDIGYPKDIVIALPGEMIKIKANFHRCGRYVWHCHLLSHEDHEMMRVMQVGNETCNEV